MRTLVAPVCALGAVLWAQDLTLHSRSEMVIAPVAVTDRKGVPVEGLVPEDLILYDNNVPQAIHVDDVAVPVSIVLVVQSTVNAPFIMDKLRKEASLLGPLIAGDRGEAALVAFAADVKVLNDFTSDFDVLAKSLRNADVMGAGGSVIDAIGSALRLLETRPSGHRRVILLIAEKHDRSSKSHFDEVVARAQRANVTIYPVTFSPALTPYTVKASNYCDPPGEQERCRNCDRTCGMCARQCYRDDGRDHPPPVLEGGGLLAVLVEMKRLANTEVAAAFARSTGGMTTTFLRKKGLEQALGAIGRDLHQQYLVSFQPDAAGPTGFHSIRAEVKRRQELVVRTRTGYWKGE